MNDLQKRLTAQKDAGRKLLIPYLTAGLPTPEAFVDLICALDGIADAVEVGIPFSDPIMDGPIIQRSSTLALSQGVTPRSVMQMIGRVKDRSDIPMAVMTYFNPVHRMGVDVFADLAASSGVGAMIVPDLPFEESADLTHALSQRGMDHIQMIAPTTSDDRAAILTRASTGFVYAVSRLGVTGTQSSLASAAQEVVARVSPHASAPVLVGIGITDPAQAAEAARFADGVIVGSAIVSLVLEGRIDEAIDLVRSMRLEMDSSP